MYTDFELKSIVFFYAGHGLQVGGQNYLVPIDAKLTTASAIDFEMVRLDLVHRTMERETSTNILIMDACRDNPLARNLARALGTRSTLIGRGLAARVGQSASNSKGGVLTEQDEKRIRSLAEKHRLLLPDFRVAVPSDDVPATLRRFVGVWVDEVGDAGRTGRKHMLIVTGVDKDGRADGFLAYGPPTPTTMRQIPAGVLRIAGTITGDTLRFSNPGKTDSHKFTLTSANQLSRFWSHTSGRNASSIMDPVWTLVAAERAAKP